ncbi:MAG: sulfotransferase domain-containing protein [Pseudomonadota bacterium]
MGLKFAFLIGVPKGGTTSVAKWLDQHSQIITSTPKEPGHFREVRPFTIVNAHTGMRRERPKDGPMLDFGAYMRLWDGVPDHHWRLDASTDYLSDPASPNKISEFAQTNTVKVFCVVRDPVERAWSEYRHTRRDGFEPLDFRASLDAEPERIEAGYTPLFHHIRRSTYHADLKSWRARFGSDLLIVDYADLGDPARLEERICAHLGLTVEGLGAIGRENAATRGQQVAPLSRLKAAAKGLLRPGTRDARPRHAAPLSDDDRRYIVDLLREDIEACLADPDVPTGSWDCARFL